ncbi:MAG: DUF1638 domain-containing protein [Desulfohalobiaceae bacterium]
MPYSQDTVIQPKSRRTVIACEVFRPELEALLAENQADVQLVFLQQNLHRTPHLMPELIQEQVDLAADRAEQIVLCYGLCCNGIVGVRAPEQGLILTKAHDCVALFLGSVKAYNRLSRERPGTYYLTRGWIEENKDPLGMLENEYVPRMGREIAEWGAKEELKHYTHFGFIDTGLGNNQQLRSRARENARFFDKEYLELKGDPSYLQRILFGPYSGQEFFLLGSKEKVQQRWYLLETA